MTRPVAVPGTLIGRAIRHYVVQSELGRGGMGVVYLAKDTLLDREVAIKVLPDELAGDPRDLNRFRQEAKLLASLNHPNIATVHGLEDTPEGGRALVLERVEGETLASRIRRGPLPLEEALGVCGQIAGALEAAHEQRVIHRDLKPGNVMIGPRGQVKVLDFGLARRATTMANGSPVPSDALESGMSTTLLPVGPSGTPGYMSPEQILLEPEDQRTDIFAFGCILFECVTGRRAFDGPTAIERTRRILAAEPDWTVWPLGAPERVRSAVVGCVQKDRARRLPTIQAVMDELETPRRGPPPSPAASPPGSSGLPRPQTSFVGRGREIAEIERVLAGPRLVTLTGPGGCGKTRISLEVARRAWPSFPGGVWFVDLAPITDPARVGRAVISAMGLRDAPGKDPADQLIAHIGDARVLLLLDNCEHLLSSSASLLDSLLKSCRELKVLTTSREALANPGEREFIVAPLAVPDPKGSRTAQAVAGSEAVQLFVDRAVRAESGFTLTDENAEAVANICLRLDGVPLAIELAAARVKVLAPAQILERLGDRFRLLTGERTAASRHRTLRAAVQWSYDHLADTERSTLRALSVFMGGWTLEAAEAVCGDSGAGFETLDGLTRLVNKSLVGVERRASGEFRYRMLETIREFSLEELEKSGEGPTIRDRHLEHFVSLVKAAEPELVRQNQGAWLGRLEAELENLLAAFDWSERVDGGLDAGLEIVSGLPRFWTRHGHARLAMTVLDRALKRAESSGPTRARAKALCVAGIVAGFAGDDRSQAFVEESLAISRALEDGRGIAHALNAMGVNAIGEDELDVARGCLEEALALARQAGDEHLSARALQNLAVVSSRQGDDRKASLLAGESIRFHRSFGDKGSEGIGLMAMAHYAIRSGEASKAREPLLQAVRIFQEHGDKRNVAAVLRVIGPLALDAGFPRVAARLAAAGISMRESLGMWLASGDKREQDAVTDRMRAAIGEAALAEEWARGRAMSYEEATQSVIDFLTGEPPAESPR